MSGMPVIAFEYSILSEAVIVTVNRGGTTDLFNSSSVFLAQRTFFIFILGGLQWEFTKNLLQEV